MTGSFRSFSVSLVLFAFLLSFVPSVFAATVRALPDLPVELNLTLEDLKAQGCTPAGGLYPVALNHAPLLADHSLDDRARSVLLRFSKPAQSSLWCVKDDPTVVRVKIISFQSTGMYADSSLTSSIKPFISVTPTRTSFSATTDTVLSLRLSANVVDSSEQLADLNRFFSLDFKNVRMVRLSSMLPGGFSVIYPGKGRDEARLRGRISIHLDDANVYNVTIPVSLSISKSALDCGVLVDGRAQTCSFTYVPGMKIRFEPFQAAALEIDGPSGQLCQSGQCVLLDVKQSSDGGYGVMVGGSLVAVIPYDQMAVAFGGSGQAVAAATVRPTARPGDTSARQAAENAIAAFIRGRFA